MTPEKIPFLKNKWNRLMAFAIVAILILLVAIAYVTDLMSVVYVYLAILLVAAGISKWLRKRRS
jgi:hypothetical protein